MRPLFSAIVKDGKVIFGDRDRWLKWLEKLEGFEVDVWVDKLKDERTLKQNAYYWGVVIEILSKEMGLIPDEVHALLKSLFLKKGIDYKGKHWEVVGSTRKLKIGKFIEYVELCQQWAMVQGINIPDPGEIVIDEL